MSSTTDIAGKREHALDVLREAGSALVAFSGGSDSTLLLALAREALGERVLAVTVRSVFIPRIERAEAGALAAALGARHAWLDQDPLADPDLRANPPQRCYLCKRALMGALVGLARREGLAVVVEGSNVDDGADYRPGARAVRELGVRSPLLEAGLTKDEIRRLSRDMDLPTWEKPAMACLASRVPYGEPLTAARLERIDAAEEHLRAQGFRQVRVRDHALTGAPGALARVEVGPEQLPALLRPEVRRTVVDELRRLGYAYIAVNLEGYRAGALNRVLDTERPRGSR